MPIAPDARNEFPPMETPRLELSFGNSEDAAVLFPYVHGEEGRLVTDTLLWNGPDVVDDLTSFFGLHETGTFAEDGFHWMLRDHTGELTGKQGRAMGTIGLEPGEQQDECEIGYWLALPYWGQGLMAEAIVAVSRLAFEAGYRTVEADVYVHNTRGRGLVEKLGFRQDKLIENYVTKRGVPTDAYRYVVTEKDLTEAVG
jgi:ribosomal-protein-alanine N-acetyltransferase